MPYKNGCLLCGSELVYADKISEKVCQVCHKTFTTQVACIQDHYICDNCHSIHPLNYLESYISKSTETNPFQMMINIMKNGTFAMHGTEHHYLIPAVFLTAIKNSGYKVPENYWQMVVERGNALPGGTCGYWGACSAAIGSGITVSILKECNPIKSSFYGEIHQVTASSLESIATIGGPRCCKRNSFLVAKSLHASLSGKFQIDLPDQEVICTFMKYNRECLGVSCPFFPQKTKE